MGKKTVVEGAGYRAEIKEVEEGWRAKVRLEDEGERGKNIVLFGVSPENLADELAALARAFTDVQFKVLEVGQAQQPTVTPEQLQFPQ